jgi:hypothetical protein
LAKEKQWQIEAEREGGKIILTAVALFTEQVRIRGFV